MSIPDRLTAALADRYHLERELGAGGMATVYLAEDLKHQRKVAIKVLRQELSATLGSERFAREIAVAARLQHPHILGLLDSGEAGDFFYYVMPYVDGETLRDRLARGGELPVQEAVRLLGEIADALAAAHKSGVVHRDIKPENILLSGRHAMVMDFGVAKAVTESTGAHPLTSVGIALGTPAYMAPEQATADPQMDGRVDIYALGVLAYEMLTGQPPFHGLNPQQMLAAHVTQAPVPLAQRRPGVSPALESVVMRCLAKRAADRFQSADDLVVALEPLTTPSGGTTPHATMPYQATMPATPTRSRRGWFIAAGVALLAVAGGGASWLLTDRPVALEFGRSRQVTRDPIPELHVAISPDGREVAYQAGWSSNSSHIVVRDVGDGQALSLTGQWGGTQWWPEWMPDGRSLRILQLRSTADPANGWWRMPRLGGEATRMDSTAFVGQSHGMSAGGWLNGDSVVIVSADGHRGVYARSGVMRDVVPGSIRVRHDGNAAAMMVGNQDYWVSWTNVAPSAIWVVVPGKPPVRVTDSVSLNTSPAWLPDGTLLYVSNRDGARDIWAVRLTRDGAPREATRKRLTAGLDAYSISVADDGRTLAYDRLILRQNIYALPMPTGRVASVREARPVTTGIQLIERFAVSGDGKWLAFDSNAEGNQEIFVMPAAGGTPRRVTRSRGDNFASSLTADGSQIAFHSTRSGAREVFVINRDGSGEQRVTSAPENNRQPTISPDGRRIAFGTNGSPQSLRLVERTTSTGAWHAPRRLPVDGRPWAPQWSPDGRQLVFDLRGGKPGIGVWSMDGTTRTIYSGDGYWPSWSSDGRALYFVVTDATAGDAIVRASVDGGTPQVLMRFDVPELQHSNTSPVAVVNGSLYFVVRELESDIYVMELERK